MPSFFFIKFKNSLTKNTPMKGVILIIISTCFVYFGIMTQIKIFKKHHPNADLLIKFLQILGIQQDTSAKGNINNGYN